MLTGVNEGNKDEAAPEGRRLFEISTDVVDANASSSPPQSPGSGETPAAFGYDILAGFHPRPDATGLNNAMAR